MSDEKGILGDFSRRKFLAVTGATVLAAPFVKTAWAADRSLTVRDPGGPVGEAYKNAFFVPFFKETGIEVIGVQAAHGPTGEIKAMVEAGNYAWDGALLGVSDVDVLAANNYLEPVGESGVNGNEIPDAYKTEFVTGIVAFATVLAYNTETMGATPPKNYADFWNVEGFPGSRSVRKHAWGTLEQALMADGVAPKDLYPLDLDRAFRKLDEIKNDVDIWWTGGAQCSQLLKTGEIDTLSTWNGRIQTAIDDGAPVKIVWDGGMASYSGFGILKGGPQADLMRELIEFSSSAVQQAEYVKYSASGPCNPNAYKHIAADMAEKLPTNPKHASKMFTLDSKWWGANLDSASERFESWLLS